MKLLCDKCGKSGHAGSAIRHKTVSSPLAVKDMDLCFKCEQKIAKKAHHAVKDKAYCG